MINSKLSIVFTRPIGTILLFSISSYLQGQASSTISNLGNVEKLDFQNELSSSNPQVSPELAPTEKSSNVPVGTIDQSDFAQVNSTTTQEGQPQYPLQGAASQIQPQGNAPTQAYPQEQSPQLRPQTAAPQYSGQAANNQYPSPTGIPQYQQQYPVQQPQAVVPYRPLPAVGAPDSLYAFQSFRLSYMQSDRVLALLKALGYSTVEFSAGRGESINESIFSEFAQPKKYPLVVKILDAAKTSLMQPSMDGGRNAMGVDRLSGTYLHQSTTGAPEQRLLIIYEKQFPEQLNALLNLLRNEVDVPASQIVIEALVVEINTNKAKELGMSYTQVDKRATSSFNSDGISSTFQSNQRGLFGWNSGRITGSQTIYGGPDINNIPYGVTTPLSGAFERINPLGFSATLNAFISDGTAEVLTNPTILVLDGRQALIRIGTQIPNTTIQKLPMEPKKV